MDLRPDPNAPLPGLPTPWAATDMPSRRDGPPFHMTEMIEAEPALAGRILERLADDPSTERLAAAIRATAKSGKPILTVGCGTSEHGAQAVAEILRRALAAADFLSAPGAGGGPIPIQAFEASLVPGLGGPGSLLIAVSHEGASWATNRAMEAARAGGATIALITAAAASPGARVADLVIDTTEIDQSWCHTVGYVSPIVAAVALAAAIEGSAASPRLVDDARSILGAGLAQTAADSTDALARRLASQQGIVVIGSGADRIAARELVLKIEEGVHLPASMRDVETLLHGHLAGMDGRTGVVAILLDGQELRARATRVRQALAAVAELGAPAGAILATEASALIPDALTPAGRVEVAPAGETRLGTAEVALLGSAIPLQLLTERMARARGVDPDPIRRDDEAYLRAANAADPEA
jgi:glucosamine--fructose-6-phosphate aminotransferase (isomerizing)